jgi:hypothetical protein
MCAILRKMQRLVYERRSSPIWLLAFLSRVGPRVGESSFGRRRWLPPPRRSRTNDQAWHPPPCRRPGNRLRRHPNHLFIVSGDARIARLNCANPTLSPGLAAGSQWRHHHQVCLTRDAIGLGWPPTKQWRMGPFCVRIAGLILGDAGIPSHHSRPACAASRSWLATAAASATSLPSSRRTGRQTRWRLRRPREAGFASTMSSRELSRQIGTPAGHVADLLVFGRGLLGVPHGCALLVHCYASISRSTASMALYLAGSARRAGRSHLRGCVAHPTAGLAVCEFLSGDAMLGRRGELVAAAAEFTGPRLDGRQYLAEQMRAGGQSEIRQRCVDARSLAGRQTHAGHLQ